jgi:hypothetical protein
MSTNPYQPPAADLVDSEPAAASGHALFYVVSPTKFLFLMIGTFGLYAVYWFYRQWKQLDRRDHRYWPIPRAIFSVFFAHALFREFDAERARRGHAFAWSPMLAANVYVISALASSVISQLTRRGMVSETVDLLSIGLLAPMTWGLYVAQRAANVAEGDPDGRANARFSWANIVWLVLGGAFWLLVLLGMLAIVTGLDGA